MAQSPPPAANFSAPAILAAAVAIIPDAVSTAAHVLDSNNTLTVICLRPHPHATRLLSLLMILLLLLPITTPVAVSASACATLQQ
jgi:hypothetical protein